MTISVFLKILIIAGIIQLILVLRIFWKKDFQRESAFQEYDSTNNYMNVCALPIYNFWNPEVSRHVNTKLKKLKICNETSKKLTELINGEWRIVEGKEGMNCSARCFEGIDDYNIKFHNWIKPGKVNCEFLEAVCWEDHREVYGYIHTQIIPKTSPEKLKFQQNPPNVFVFLMDSMGTGQAKRSFPRTLSFLSNRFESVEFPFINKIGENSMPNGAALWFGKLIDSINAQNYGGLNIPADISRVEFCDTLKNNSILEEFRDHGYMVCEQNFRSKKGCAWKLSSAHNLIYPISMHIDFYKPMFSWIWLNDLGHDKFNGFIRHDGEVLDLFRKNEELFDNSFVLFMGDHGFRLGMRRFLQSEIGGFEMHNPYLSISLPKSLRTSETLNVMRENAKQLQTHFDTRATLLDILKYQPSENFKNHSLLNIPDEKGHSYFRRQPSFPRTCGRLPILPQFCICRVEKIPIEDEPLRNHLGILLLLHIHSLLEKANLTDLCESFEFRQTTSLFHLGRTNHSSDSHNYEITVMAGAPSYAHFQTTLTQDKKNGNVNFGNLVRLDSYGRSGDCTKNGELEKLCYCKGMSIFEKLEIRFLRNLKEVLWDFEDYLV